MSSFFKIITNLLIIIMTTSVSLTAWKELREHWVPHSGQPTQRHQSQIQAWNDCIVKSGRKG